MRMFRITACAFIMVVSLVCSAGTDYVDDEPKKAQVGQASRSSGMTFTPSVEIAFDRARANAMARRDSALSTERVLIELLEEETARSVLSSANVDVGALRADLVYGLGVPTSRLAPGDEPRAVESLQNVMRRAVVAALTSNAKGASGADILAAMLVEGDTYAAQLLKKYGLTIETVENTKLELYLHRNKEQTKRLSEMQQLARSQRELTKGVISKRHQAGALHMHSETEAEGKNNEGSFAHKSYVLRISSDDADHARVLFKAAISRNGLLDLYVEQTPFEIEFVASTVVALFEAVEAGDRLKVQLIAEIDGEERVVSGFGGSAGAIFNDTRNVLGQRSGYLD